MSRQESIHALFNQLAVVLGRADLLRIQSKDSTSQEAANLIKLAALRMQSLILQLSDERNEARFPPQTREADKDWSSGKQQECVLAGAADIGLKS